MRIFRLTFALLAALAMAMNAHGASVGAGTGILGLENANNAVDTPSDGENDQSRINIDDSFTVMLGPGEYTVPTWSFHAGQTGSAIPFLAVETAPDVYQLLSAGDQVDVGGGDLDVDMTVPFGGPNFTLDAETQVFAGVVNPPAIGMQNPIYTNLASGSTVDHDNNNNGGVQAAIDTGVAEGFGHANLGRSYAFSIDVNPVPEPTATYPLLVLLGIAGLSLRRRMAK